MTSCAKGCLSSNTHDVWENMEFPPSSFAQGKLQSASQRQQEQFALLDHNIAKHLVVMATMVTCGCVQYPSCCKCKKIDTDADCSTM